MCQGCFFSSWDHLHKLEQWTLSVSFKKDSLSETRPGPQAFSESSKMKSDVTSRCKIMTEPALSREKK